MRSIAVEELGCISGAGLTDSQANQIIGEAIGAAWHGITSTEGQIGSVFGLGGMIAGSIIHFKLHH